VIGVPAQVDGQKSIRREIDDLIEKHVAKSTKATKGKSKKGGKKGGAKGGKKAKKGSVVNKTEVFEGALLGSVTVGQGLNQSTANNCVEILNQHNAEPDGIFLQLGESTVRVFGRNLHSRMPLVPTHARLKLLQVCDKCHSSRVFTASYQFTL
jgi:hypothetical protein